MVLLTWTLNKPTGVEGGRLSNPAARDVEEKLLGLDDTGGSLTIDMSEDSGSEKSLQVLAHAGQFVVTLGYETDDDYEVRSYNGPRENLRMIEIGGNLHRSDSVCNDHELVSKIVLGFLETGDAPAQLLS
jgi:hypothetical protein